MCQDDGSGRQRWLLAFEAVLALHSSSTTLCPVFLASVLKMRRGPNASPLGPSTTSTTAARSRLSLYVIYFAVISICGRLHPSTQSRWQLATAGAADLHISPQHGLCLHAHRLDSHAHLCTWLPSSACWDGDSYGKGSGARRSVCLANLSICEQLGCRDVG